LDLSHVDIAILTGIQEGLLILTKPESRHSDRNKIDSTQ